MKNIILLILLSTSIYAHSQVPNYVPSQGLIGWWPFNGNANDESGNGHNGSVIGATLVSDRFSNSNSAYSFNGTSNEIVITHTDTLNAFPLSISVWFNTSSNNRGMLVNKYGCQTYNGYAVHISQSKPSSYFFSSKGNGINVDVNSSSFSNVADSSWHHIAVTVDTIGLIYYLDGSVVDTFTFTGNKSGSSNTENLRFGRYPKANCPNDYFFHDGLIDDIGIWNRVLSSQEIATLYNASNTNIQNVFPLNSVKIYPNPANEFLNIDFGDAYINSKSTIKIANSLGQSIYESTLNDKVNSIDLSTIDCSGLVFVYIFDSQNQIIDIKKIVID